MQSSQLPDRRCFPAVVLAIPCLLLVSSPAWAQPPGMPGQESEPGLSIHDAQAFQGYSLVAPMNSTTTYLIDMEGRVVNRWESEFVPGASAYLLKNGHLLRTGAEPGSSLGGAGAGGRIQEFSWDGELVWDYSLSTERMRPHHDICPMPNGNVLVIAWDKKTADEAVSAGRIPESVRGQFLPDCILEVRPTGKTSGEIVWKWHAWDHIIQEVDEGKPNYGEVAEHPERIDINFGTHVMASMINDPEQGTFFSMNISGAQRLPNGNTFICSGAQGILFEVTPEKEIVWKYAIPNPGPGGPGGPHPMRPGDFFPGFLQDMLRMTDAQKTELSELQQEVKSELSQILTDSQRERLENPMPFEFGSPPRGRDPNGRHDGAQPAIQRGPGGLGRPGGPVEFTPPRPGEIIPSMLMASLKLSEEQTSRIGKLQNRLDDRLTKVLTEDQKSQLAEMQRRFARGPGT